MSCDNFRGRFPQEGTVQLYRGLVQDSEKGTRFELNKNNTPESARNKRERMRVLEILGHIKTKKSLNGRPFSTIQKQPVDRPSFHLGSNARKRRQMKGNIPLVTTCHPLRRMTKPQKPVQFNRKRTFCQTSKKRNNNRLKQKNNIKLPKTNFSKVTSTKEEEYVWHPLQVKKKGQCESPSHQSKRAIHNVMKHYHNQYHKQIAQN